MMRSLRKRELAKRTSCTKNSIFLWLSLTFLPGAHIPVEPQEAFTKVGIPGHASAPVYVCFTSGPYAQSWLLAKQVACVNQHGKPLRIVQRFQIQKLRA